MRRSFLAVTTALTMFVALGPAWQAPDSGPYKVLKTARVGGEVAGTTSMLTPLDAGCIFREARRARLRPPTRRSRCRQSRRG
jgi:hypothetical protein